MFSPELQEALSGGGAKGWRIVSTMHPTTGCVACPTYIVDNATRRVYVVATSNLETLARSCPFPDSAAFMRSVHAQYKAEQSGQVGHA